MQAHHPLLRRGLKRGEREANFTIASTRPTTKNRETLPYITMTTSVIRETFVRQTTNSSLRTTRGVTDVEPGNSDEDALSTRLLSVAVHTLRGTPTTQVSTGGYPKRLGTQEQRRRDH